MTANGLGEQLLGQGAVLASGEHPSHHIAAIQIEHHVQAQKRAFGPSRQFGDVPAPHHVGRIGHKPWHGVVGLGALHAALARFARCTEQPMHRTQRAHIASLIEQLGVDLRRGLIGKARLVQHIEHRLTLGLREPTRIAASPARRLWRLGPDPSVQRGSRELQCRTGTLQRDQPISLGDERAHGMSAGCVAASSSCAFLRNSPCRD